MKCINNFLLLMCAVFLLTVTGCREGHKEAVSQTEQSPGVQQDPDSLEASLLVELPEGMQVPDGMVWIPGGLVKQGAVPQDQMAMEHEKPAHLVGIDGFLMDQTEVTNAQFARFVEGTAYITVAERDIDWEELKKQLPEGTPKPADSLMQPGSLTFKKAAETLPNLYDFSQWWRWTIGANWRHPHGPGSDLKGKDNYPVVHIAYEDAIAYCEWAGHRLPTEAEWELAARAGHEDSIFFWGDNAGELQKFANTWEGEFPVTNILSDGYEFWAPVKSYQPNDYGLYDMAGNVWEWTSDWYNSNYYRETAGNNGVLRNPSGPETAYNNRNPYAREKVIKGGSFLCSASYCASYRVSARMGTSLDSSLEHLGFRTVKDVK